MGIFTSPAMRTFIDQTRMAGLKPVTDPRKPVTGTTYVPGPKIPEYNPLPPKSVLDDLVPTPPPLNPPSLPTTVRAPAPVSQMSSEPSMTYVQAPGPAKGESNLSEDERQRMAAAAMGRNAAGASAAAGLAGQKTESANANAMAAASDAAARPASVQPTPPIAPAAPAQEDPSRQLYTDVLGQLSAGINSDRPLPGTAAAIQQSRDALATYARNAEARAGAVAAKGGSLGQGTANQMAQAVRGDVLSELANTELNNAQLVSGEKQSLIDRAIQAGQYGMNREDNKAQFDATMAQRKEEFSKTFGAQEAGNYLNQLERIAMDNPVLAAKLTDHLLQGKTGAVGSFTSAEKAEIQAYVSKKQGQQDKLTEVMNTIIGTIPGQIKASEEGVQEEKKKADEAKLLEGYTKKLNTLQAGGYLTPEEFKALEASGGIKKFSATGFPSHKEGYQDLVGSNPSGIVSVDGVQYRVGAFSQPRTGSGTFTNQERHTDVVELIASDGTKKYAYDGKLHDKPPKTVSNDITPFGI